MKQSNSVVDEATAELSEVGFTVEKIMSIRKPELRLVAKKDHELFSLKLIDKNSFFQNDHMKDFYNNEATLGNKVKSNFPHLVCQHDFFFTKHFAVFVYSYYESGTMKEYFEDQEFNLLQLIILLKDLFLGLEELRSLGYVHRHLHEGNIYVVNQTLKIGGFEHCERLAAKHMNFNYHLFVLNSMKDVLQAIPPEVTLNRCCTVKTSMYCVGSLLFRLLYKEPHFKAASLNDVLKIYTEKNRFKAPADLPPDFQKLLRRALEYDMESRLSPYELKQELAYLLTYCKSFEDEIRMSVYLKKIITAFKDIQLRELKHIKIDAHPDVNTKAAHFQVAEPSKSKVDAIRILKVTNKRADSKLKQPQESTTALPLFNSTFKLEPNPKYRQDFHLRGVEEYRRDRARHLYRAEKVINTSIHNRREGSQLLLRAGNRSVNCSLNMSHG